MARAEPLDKMGHVRHAHLLHCTLQLQTAIVAGRGIRKLVGLCGPRLPERLVHVYAEPDGARAGVLQLRRRSLRQLSREWEVQLLLVQPATLAHVRGQAVSRFFGVGLKRVR